MFLLILGVRCLSRATASLALAVAGCIRFGAEPWSKISAGIFIIGENQYRIGDVVPDQSNISGRVESLSLRMTSLRDLEGKVHYIPNGTILVVTNMTMEYAI